MNKTPSPQKINKMKKVKEMTTQQIFQELKNLEQQKTELRRELYKRWNEGTGRYNETSTPQPKTKQYA